MQAFGIFEGGGAKGLAHVGALYAAHDRGIEFVGVAGASAGAIVAALIAAGYVAGELFDPTKPDDASKMYSRKASDLVDGDFADVRTAIAALDRGSSGGMLRAGWETFRFNTQHSKLFARLKSDLGLLGTWKLEKFLNECLTKKILLRQESTDQPIDVPLIAGEQVQFRHIQMPLKIVATDVTRGKVIVFSQDESPTYEVCKAVAASIAFPFVFKPQSVDLTKLKSDCSGSVKRILAIDGGLLSNFPAWLFDLERTRLGPATPTFGFRLVERATDKATADDALRFKEFGKRIFRTVVAGDPILETRQIENLHEIPLAVSAQTFDFDMTSEQMLHLFNEGNTAASENLDRPGIPRDHTRIKIVLEEIAALVKAIIGSEEDVRVNIVCLTTQKSLRVTYTWNMDGPDDTDDQLEFEMGSGACSQCWQTQKPVVCDLEQAKRDFKEKWKMSKYQQAMVKRSQRSLVCYPILKAGLNPEMIGVLNLDSAGTALFEAFAGDIEDDAGDFGLQQTVQSLARMLVEPSLGMKP